jgi:hypothetical protein
LNEEKIEKTKEQIKYKEPEQFKLISKKAIQKQEPKYSIYKSERWKPETPQ